MIDVRTINVFKRRNSLLLDSDGCGCDRDVTFTTDCACTKATARTKPTTHHIKSQILITLRPLLTSHLFLLLVTTVSVRLPGTSQSVDVTVGANESLSDALTATMARLGTLKRVSARRCQLDMLADGLRAQGGHQAGARVVVNGRLHSAGDAVSAGDSVELWGEPVSVPVVVHGVGDSVTSSDVLVDLSVELAQMADVIDKQRTLLFAAVDAPGAAMRWLRLNVPLNAQRVSARGGLVLHAFDASQLLVEPALSVGSRLGNGGSFEGDACPPVSAAPHRPAADASVAAIHRAVLSVQTRQREQTQLSARRDVQCVLKDHLLYLYESPAHPLPLQCVALELFVALSITLSGNRRAIVLRRSNRQLDVAPKENVDFVLLQAGSDEQLALWRGLLRERCLSGQKVFGVPLDEVLERQQRKPPVPKVIESLVGYLDVNALPIRVPRLMLQPPSSMALLQCLRDDADHGRSLELGTCRDPHAVAYLLRLYFAELPEPLLGFEAYDVWLASPETGVAARPRADWEPIICNLVAVLEIDRFILLKYIVSFLLRVVESVASVTAADLAKAFATSLLRPREIETDTPALQQAALAVTQLLIEQHKKLYTLKDGKKMRLEFKSQRQPPVVDLTPFADPALVPPPPSAPSPGSRPPPATAAAPAPLVSRSNSTGPAAAPLPSPSRSPRGPPPSAAAAVSAPTTPRGPARSKPQLPDALQRAPAENAADARKRLAAMRAATTGNDAMLNDYKTVLLFLRKNLSTWMKRRSIPEPEDGGGGAPGASMTLDRNAFVTITFATLDQMIEQLVSLVPQQPDAAAKLAMIARTLQFAHPEP